MANNKVVDLASHRRVDEALDDLYEAGGSATGGGGKGGGVEARVAVLEVKVDRLISDLGDLQKASASTREDLATLKERVAHLPSKGYIATWISSAIALIVAAVSAITIFQQQLQGFFHAGH